MKIIFNTLKTMEILQTGTEYLKTCGVTEARTEADLLLSFVLDITRDKLYLEREREISVQERERYERLLKRRGIREPLAYLVKTREFMGLDFYVDQRVLIPRPETELLVEKCLEIGKKTTQAPSMKILDLCTGSGAIAISLAIHWTSAIIVGVDISKEALDVAAKNAVIMGVNIDYREGDLFTPVKGDKYNMIVSNPPYVSEGEYLECLPEVKKEPAKAFLAGKDGLDFYRKIALEGEEYLLPGGMIMMEIGHSQGLTVTNLFRARGYQTVLFSDYAGLDRIVMAKKE